MKIRKSSGIWGNSNKNHSKVLINLEKFWPTNSRKEEKKDKTRITANGKEVTEPGDIRKELKFFYSKLYQEKPIETTDLERYIGKIGSTILSDTQLDRLNTEITQEEIQDAI